MPLGALFARGRNPQGDHGRAGREAVLSAIALHRSGRLDDAEAAYLKILRKDRKDPDAMHYLGVMLFQMLCGEVPFKGSSIPSIMKKHLTTDVPSLASKGVEVPPQIESVVRHALEKEADRRTASADEFSRPFQEFVTEYCWGGPWTRPALDRKARSMITLGILTALSKPKVTS